MRSVTIVTAALLFMCAVAAGAQQKDSWLAYAYPAGGEVGTTFRVTVAGQFLKGADSVIISGRGVKASVVDYTGPSGPLSKLQEDELKRRLDEATRKKAVKNQAGTQPSTGTGTNADGNGLQVTLPDIPEFANLDALSAKDLRQVFDRFLNRDTRPKAPMNEIVELEVSIDPNAEPGRRELRLLASGAVSNPVAFYVGLLLERSEPGRFDLEPQSPPKALVPPLVLNGQIFPGETDTFRLALGAGQTLLCKARARALIPYLADAVPGWFQAVMSIQAPDGTEVAYSDDNGSDPDPLLRYTAPSSGIYTLSIRDAIYRGRFDFVYRIEVEIGPSAPDAAITGGAAGAFASQVPGSGWSGALAIPSVVSGAISAPKETDAYSFSAVAGDTLVAEIRARRDGSPLDARLALLDSAGKVLAFNDDFEDRESGLITHHADPYLRYRIPSSGAYSLIVSDITLSGGPAYTYTLKVGLPAEDFSVMTDRSAINIPLSGSGMFSVAAVRKDGWDGDIIISLKNPLPGLSLEGGRIPKGKDVVKMTLSYKGISPSIPSELELEARATIAGVEVAHPVRPTDRMMQAFATFHYVPADTLYLGFARGRGKAMSISYVPEGTLKIPAGGTVELKVDLRPMPAKAIGSISLELVDPPVGISLKEAKVTRNGFTLLLAADAKLVGFADTLVVRARVTVPTSLAGAKGDQQAQAQTIDIGFLPAIAVEVVRP